MIPEVTKTQQSGSTEPPIWLWDIPRGKFKPHANIDYLASDPATGIEYLSDKAVNPSLRPIYRSRNAVRRFKAFHSPPIEVMPAVDSLWSEIILNFVPQDRVQFLPVDLIARGDVCRDFFMLIALDRVRAVDLEKSEITRKIVKPGVTLVFGMKKIVLKPDGLNGLHLARDEQSHHLLVSNALKQALSATGQDSVFFKPEDFVTLENLLEGGFSRNSLQ